MLYLIKEVMQKRSSKPTLVSLKNRNAFLEYKKILQIVRLVILLSILGLMIISFTFENAIAILGVWAVVIILLIKQFNWIKRLADWIQDYFFWDFLLLEFIVKNSLYYENGYESAVFSYEVFTDEIVISGIKYGDRFSERIESLDTTLSALLNLPLTEKIIRAGLVEYHFQTNKPKRLHLTTSESPCYTNKQEINLGYGFEYDPAKCPHIIVAGGTGSGKSVFISFLILELFKKKSEIFICDPKNADLGNLSVYLGTKKVATSPSSIAKVVRLAVEEMKKRYEYMNDPDHFRYGSNFVDHNMNQIWLIFDEMGAFVATATDKKSKEVVNEVMDGLKQLILLGRQAGTFVLIAGQQMRTENLSSELRDNLGLRIALGANSSEGYRMVLGSATPQKLPPIEVKGSGLLYMQGSGKETAQYYDILKH